MHRAAGTLGSGVATTVSSLAFAASQTAHAEVPEAPPRSPPGVNAISGRQTDREGRRRAALSCAATRRGCDDVPGETGWEARRRARTRYR